MTPAPTRLVQRNCGCGESAGLGAKCVECSNRALTLQRNGGDDRSLPNTVPAIVHDVLRSSGRPLEAEVRSKMEAGFGHDFSRVRVHTDTSAAESARALNARAFTVGQHIVFGGTQYSPISATGNRLLAHELVHTIQQSGTSTAGELAISNPSDNAEREADAAAQGVLAQENASLPIGSAPAVIARAPDDPPPAPTSTQTSTGSNAGTSSSTTTPSQAPTGGEPVNEEKPKPPPKKVCLTFDDGPRDPGTQEVLNALGSIKATFFLQGSKMVPTERLMTPEDEFYPAATKQAQLLAQILGKGHQIANHTFWHVPFRKEQYEALKQKPQEEQDKTIQEGFTKNLAYFQRLYEDHKEAFAAEGITSFPGFTLGRLPGHGKFYPPYVALVEGLGLKHVGWHTEFAPRGGLGAPLGTRDWKGITGLDAEIKANGCTGANWILLLHDPLWGGKQALLESLIGKLKSDCNAEFGVLDAGGKCS